MIDYIKPAHSAAEFGNGPSRLDVGRIATIGSIVVAIGEQNVDEAGERSERFVFVEQVVLVGQRFEAVDLLVRKRLVAEDGGVFE